MHALGAGAFLGVSTLSSMCVSTLGSLALFQALRECAHPNLLPCSSGGVSGVCAFLRILSLDITTGMSGDGALVCLLSKSSACVITPLSLFMADIRHAAGLWLCQVLCRLAHGTTRSSCCAVTAACGTKTLGLKLTLATLRTLGPACAACPSMWSFVNVAVLKAVQVLPSSTSKTLSPSALTRVRPPLGTTEPHDRNAEGRPPARGDCIKLQRSATRA